MYKQGAKDAPTVHPLGECTLDVEQLFWEHFWLEKWLKFIKLRKTATFRIGSRKKPCEIRWEETGCAENRKQGFRFGRLWYSFGGPPQDLPGRPRYCWKVLFVPGTAERSTGNGSQTPSLEPLFCASALIREFSAFHRISVFSRPFPTTSCAENGEQFLYEQRRKSAAHARSR